MADKVSLYQAVQKTTKQKVAVKVLLAGAFASPSTRARFEREIELVVSLKHPNIVGVYDSGVADGCPFYVMEYIRGQPLTTYVTERELSARGILRLFERICAAVTYAHQNGVIHRDLKPGNILIDANGDPHILDFGLAKVAGPDLAENGLPVTVTGDFIGTLAYASPEQTTGDPSQVDIRTDVYSLGVILYEMLTGHYPYPVVGQIAEVLRHIVETMPEPPSSWYRRSRREEADHLSHKVDNELETIILKALAKERERRYQSAETLGSDLRRYLMGEPIEAKQDSAWYVLRKLARRHVYATTTVISLFVILGSSSFVSFDFYRQTRAALREREKSYDVLAERNEQLDHLVEGTHPAVRYKALASFPVGVSRGRSGAGEGRPRANHGAAVA